MPSPSSTVELLDLVRRSGVVTDDALDRCIEDGPPLPESPGQCAAALVKRGLLTTFQAKLLLTGKHRGFKLGSYVVRDQLGRGGMGAVFLAEHEGLKRQVALKVLTGMGTDPDPLTVARFLREARAAAALDHPNIVRIFDVAKQGDLQYLVMEHVEGKTLEALMQKSGPLPHAKVAEWVAHVAAGLQHAHELGFVHRDIKPANLMVTKHGVVKILDMGLARSGGAEDRLTEMMDKGAVVGTADYIAPEQAISGDTDIRADIYSLGATFYALIAGRPPFGGSTTQKLIHHQMTEAPALAEVIPSCPEGLAMVVAKMLAKKPEHRYQTPADVIEALVPWLPDGAAARVMAGLTNMGGESAVHLQQTLSTAAGNSSKRLAHPGTRTAVARKTATLPAVKPEPVESTVDEDAAEPAVRSKWMMIGLAWCAGFLVAGIGLVAGWLALR